MWIDIQTESQSVLQFLINDTTKQPIQGYCFWHSWIYFNSTFQFENSTEKNWLALLSLAMGHSACTDNIDDIIEFQNTFDTYNRTNSLVSRSRFGTNGANRLVVLVGLCEPLQIAHLFFRFNQIYWRGKSSKLHR